MQKWEYLVRRGISNEKLNEYGSIGWELVSVDNYYAYFKRKISDEKASEVSNLALQKRNG